MWSSLVKAFLVISDWCVWKIGKGNHVQIGSNPSVGGSKNWKLSENII